MRGFGGSLVELISWRIMYLYFGEGINSKPRCLLRDPVKNPDPVILRSVPIMRICRVYTCSSANDGIQAGAELWVVSWMGDNHAMVVQYRGFVGFWRVQFLMLNSRH